MNNEPLFRKDLSYYGVAAIPLAFAGVPLYLYVPDFYATQFHISLTAIGFALLGLRFIDAVQDPLIGYFSDKYSAKRLKLMLFSALLLVTSFFLLFKPAGPYPLVWLCIMLFLVTTAFSTLSINLNALGGLWSQEAHNKTRIAGYREGFGLVGLLLAVSLPGMLQNSLPASTVFTWVSAVLLVFTCIAMALFSTWYKTHNLYSKRSDAVITLKMRLLSISASMKRLLSIYALSMFASSIPSLLVFFYIRDFLQGEAFTGLFLLLYFASAIVAIPLWNYISRLYGKRNTWVIAMLFAVVSFIGVAFLTPGNIWQYSLLCFLSGMAFSADLILPPSMLADEIQHHTEEKNASFYYGLLAFVAKLALAVASFVTLSFLEFVDFHPARENTPYALTVLSLLYTIPPCGLKLCSAILLLRSQFNTGVIYEKNRGNPTNRSNDYA